MGLPKGRTNNKKGRTVGVKNKRTYQWEQLGTDITGIHLNRFNDVLTSLDDAEFAKVYLQVLEYFKPKLQRTEIQGEIETKEVQTITMFGRKIVF